ncbi:MAG TPA: hypothetical protein VGL08_01320 [Paraburkholderia sp.]
MLLLGVACAVPGAPSAMADEPFNPMLAQSGAQPADPPNASYQTLNDQQQPCQEVSGEAEIEGTQQRISGVACRQPDGTWQMQQAADGGGAPVYPAPDGSYYGDDGYYGYGPYPYAWYWGAPIGFGATFVFVDRFNHFHHINHVHFGHPHGFGGHGGFHGGHSWGGGGFHGGGHGGGGHR